MQDILKALVNSRQQGGSAQGADPMTELIGGLLGGQGQQSQPQGGGQQQTGLGDMMGLLESVMNGGQQSGTSTNDPIMALLQPFVAPLAKKANIPPEIAMVVVSFVAHKLLAHHPTSGRDSNSFNFEEMFNQMASGSIDPALLQNSGMVKEISAKTGLDEATAEQSLNLAFNLVGKGATSLINRGNAQSPKPAPAAPSGGKKTLKDAGFAAKAKKN
ncbi:MAG: hypothetical protein K8S20_08150 [Chloroflexi bacterium]|nr:hypothetical protein [Chloroflexota bacterium]